MTASMDEEAPAMESMRWVGVDVHAKESVAVVLDQASGEIRTQRIAGRPDEVVEWLSTLEQPFRAVYEAGPTGDGVVGLARERGRDVVVCALGRPPSQVAAGTALRRPRLRAGLRRRHARPRHPGRPARAAREGPS